MTLDSSNVGTCLETRRDIDNLLSGLSDCLNTHDPVRLSDGWREPIADSLGYRYVYDREVADGGWEFHQLRPGLWFLTVDMVASQPLFRRHSFGRKLVLTAVLNGGVEFHDRHGGDGELSNGYCTVYGMEDDDGFETVYQPGQSLRWVSIIIDRDRLFEATDLRPYDVPDVIRHFAEGDATVPYFNTPLTPAAFHAATQILDCNLEGGFRRTFLSAKALELICLELFALKNTGADMRHDMTLTPEDHAKIRKAMQYLRRSIEDPPKISELAYAVDMTRSKLQFGFRHVFGDTVGQVRDKLRIEQALDLVQHSSKSMIDIAMEIGYEHPASFTRAFKAAFGLSPIQMRRMAQNTAPARGALKKH